MSGRQIDLKQTHEPFHEGPRKPAPLAGLLAYTVGDTHINIVPTTATGKMQASGFHGIAPADARRLAAALIECANECEAWRWKMTEEQSVTGESEWFIVYPIDYYIRQLKALTAVFKVSTIDTDYIFDGQHDKPAHVRAAEQWKKCVAENECAYLYVQHENAESMLEEDCAKDYLVFAYGPNPDDLDNDPTKFTLYSNC